MGSVSCFYEAVTCYVVIVIGFCRGNRLDCFSCVYHNKTYEPRDCVVLIIGITANVGSTYSERLADC